MKRLNEVERRLAERVHRRVTAWTDSAGDRGRYRSGNPVLRRRYALAEAILVGGILINAAFVPFDLFITGYLVHAVCEAAAAAGLLGALAAMRRTGRIDRPMLAASLIVAITMLVIVFTGRAIDSVLVWVPLFPAIPGFLLGVRRGLYVTGAFYTVLFAGLIHSVMMGGPQGFNWVSVTSAAGASLVTTVLVFYYELSRSDVFRHLEQAANTDPLTGALNRRGFQDRFDAELARAQRTRTPISLLILDVDHFKRINDEYGHDTGDAAIRHLANLLKAHTRRNDVVGRLGGEEFALALSDAALPQARLVAEKLRRLVEATPLVLPGGTPLVLTVSIGAAEVTDEASQFRTLFSIADRRLYAAKKAGRNRVCIGDAAVETAG
ncbi:GGDEF domain-containing protein [Azospirillum halopraeferens]|uniref:GGDEF domain-containing protein n=1 Tax=Azospirillum halopraeferens TaxID=34010 RepID=UPI00040A8ADD|nr:GGDEF domain-containing protein [Azospirillum halopraeferens]